MCPYCRTELHRRNAATVLVAGREPHPWEDMDDLSGTEIPVYKMLCIRCKETGRHLTA